LQSWDTASKGGPETETHQKVDLRQNVLELLDVARAGLLKAQERQRLADHGKPRASAGKVSAIPNSYFLRGCPRIGRTGNGGTGSCDSRSAFSRCA
jgi:hypothetical protein